MLCRLRQTPIILQEYDSIIRKHLELGIVQPVEESDHGEVGQEYDSIIRKHLELGIVQPVEESDHGEVGQVHYLPHHAVVRQDKETTKVRVAYDTSAKSGGPSLNDGSKIRSEDFGYSTTISLLPCCLHRGH